MRTAPKRPHPCWACQGHGYVWPTGCGAPSRNGAPQGRGTIPCIRCKGTGRSTSVNRGTSIEAARDAACAALWCGIVSGDVLLSMLTPSERAAVRAWIDADPERATRAAVDERPDLSPDHLVTRRSPDLAAQLGTAPPSLESLTATNHDSQTTQGGAQARRP